MLLFVNKWCIRYSLINKKKTSVMALFFIKPYRSLKNIMYLSMPVFFSNHWWRSSISYHLYCCKLHFLRAELPICTTGSPGEARKWFAYPTVFIWLMIMQIRDMSFYLLISFFLPKVICSNLFWMFLLLFTV